MANSLQQIRKSTSNFFTIFGRAGNRKTKAFPNTITSTDKKTNHLLNYNISLRSRQSQRIEDRYRFTYKSIEKVKKEKTSQNTTKFPPGGNGILKYIVCDI